MGLAILMWAYLQYLLMVLELKFWKKCTLADKIGEYVKRSGGQDLIDELLASDLGQKSKSAKAGLEDMKLFLKYSDLFGCADVVSFDLSLARGLDYYTGIIYEAILTDDNKDEKGMVSQMFQI